MAPNRVIRTGPDLTSDLERLGLPCGGLVMVHSSLRSIGTVAGGAATAVDALLAALGPTGTLVAPTFTGQFRDPDFVYDPAETPGTTGAIPNHVFRRPDARRTVHIVQTVAAIGPLRDDIIDAGGHDGWDAQPSMRAIFDLDGWFLLLGVPYQNLTAGHFMEQEIGTHRRPRVTEGRQRTPDGRVVPLRSETWGPDPNFPGMPERSYDFNRLGEGLEAARPGAARRRRQRRRPSFPRPGPGAHRTGHVRRRPGAVLHSRRPGDAVAVRRHMAHSQGPQHRRRTLRRRSGRGASDSERVAVRISSMRGIGTS